MVFQRDLVRAAEHFLRVARYVFPSPIGDPCELPRTPFVDRDNEALKAFRITPRSPTIHNAGARSIQIREGDQPQWASGVGAFINSTNILLNLARSKSIWISTSCEPSFGLSLSVHVSVFP